MRGRGRVAAEDLERAVGRAVVDDEELEVAERLVQEAFDGLETYRSTL